MRVHMCMSPDDAANQVASGHRFKRPAWLLAAFINLWKINKSGAPLLHGLKWCENDETFPLQIQRKFYEGNFEIVTATTF